MNEIKPEPTNGKMENTIESVYKDTKLNQAEKEKENLCSPSELLLNIAMAAIDYNFNNMVNNAVTAKITQIKEEGTNEALKLVEETVKENEQLKKEVAELKEFNRVKITETQYMLNNHISQLKEEKIELESLNKKLLEDKTNIEKTFQDKENKYYSEIKNWKDCYFKMRDELEDCKEDYPSRVQEAVKKELLYLEKENSDLREKLQEERKNTALVAEMRELFKKRLVVV